MEGTLDTFGVVEMLQLLGRTKLSGTLHIECPERLIDVRFLHGRIAETRDSTRARTGSVIGRQLVRHGLLDERRLAEALTEQEVKPRPLGTLLVDRGFVAEAELRDVLSRQVANTLMAARVETSGDFLFVRDWQPSAVDFITIDTQSVLLDISTLGGEYCLAVEILGEDGTILVRNDYQGQDDVGRDQDEAKVLAKVDGRRTVRDLVNAAGLEEITAIRVLGRLVEDGVLLVKLSLQADQQSDPVLRSHRDLVWTEVSRLFETPSRESADL